MREKAITVHDHIKGNEQLLHFPTKNEIKGITISTLLKKEAITFVFLSLIVSSDKVKFFLSISFEI